MPSPTVSRSQRRPPGTAPAAPGPVAAESAQAALLADDPALVDAGQHRDSSGAEPGWYVDPTCASRLRRFDGERWTWRTIDRPPVSPSALTQVVRRVRVSRASRGRQPRWMAPAPVRRYLFAKKLPTRAHTSRWLPGSVPRGVAVLMCLVAVCASVMMSWSIWGTSWVAGDSQQHLADQLGVRVTPRGASLGARSLAALNGLVPGRDDDPSISSTGGDRGSAQPTNDDAPPSFARAPDITPWPPAGWTVPRSRPVAVLPDVGEAFARLQIPALGVDAITVVGTDRPQLEEGPGVWTAGAVPGSPGNATIAAHRTTFGAWFENLDRLGYGDQIILDVPGHPTAVYEVRGRTITDPENVGITGPTAGVRLTLSTCNPKYGSSERLVVSSEMISGEWLDKALPRSTWNMLG